MYSLEFVVVALTALTTLPTTSSLSSNLSYIRFDSSTGPHSMFVSEHIPYFGIRNVWDTQGGTPPPWLRSINVKNTIILLDNLIETYSAHPPEDIATYNSTGPESSTAFSGFDTRLIVKQWVKPKGSSFPVAPMRNKEIVEAVGLVKQLYLSTWFPKKEWGWYMCYSTPIQRYFSYCTGVLLVQRDLWYSGMVV